MSKNRPVFSTQPEAEETKIERGPKYTPPQTFRIPKGSTFSSWNKSLEGQISHLQTIMEEAKKCANIPNYTPNIKIGKRFKHFFDEEVLEVRRRSKQKKKRNKKNG